MWFDIFVQAIGFVAIAMNVISVQFNKHFLIMLFKSLGSLLFALQYLLLGGYTGMVMDLVGVIRNFVFAYNVSRQKSNKWWIVLFCIITAGAGITTIILTWSKTIEALTRWSSNLNVLTFLAVMISILSVSAKLLSTIGYGAKSPHLIRMINLPTFSMWIIYNIMLFSIAGIISDSMSIVSIIIAEMRFRKTPENPKIPASNPPIEQESIQD